MNPACLGHFLRCPICDGSLDRVEKTLVCANGHAFDVAREGYVNFQAALGRPARTPGDTREMLAARSAFVQRGLYRPLNDATDEFVQGILRVRAISGDLVGPVGVLDAGCGVGFVLGHLKEHLNRQLPRLAVCYFGSDISKDAIRRSARGYPGILFVVASTTTRLPFASIDILLNTFAPRNPAEFHRITSPRGALIVVIPTANHLIEARQALGLLGIQEEKERRVVEQLEGLFQLTHAQTVEYAMSLDRQDLRNLIVMTPNYWHQTQEIVDKVKVIDGLQTTASFKVLVFQRLGATMTFPETSERICVSNASVTCASGK